MAKSKSLIFAYLLDREGGGKPIGWDEITTWTPEQGLLWMHLDYSSSRTQQWLNKQSGLDKISSHALYQDESRPRSVINPKSLLIFLRAVNLNPGEDAEDMVSIRLWLDDHRIITTRKRKLLSVEDIRSAVDKGHGPKSPAELLTSLNYAINLRIAEVVESIEEKVDLLEEEMLSTQSYLLRPKIADIRRQSITLKRYLSPQREALNRLYNEQNTLLNTVDRIHLREAIDKIIRNIEDLDAARERAAVTQEELASRLSEQMDSRMYLLSVVAVVFMPLSFITGLLGINVGGIPGANYSGGFAVVTIVLLGILVLMLSYFYRKKWL